MEGASHEAASLAGHLGLGKLTWIYDDNRITIEGPTELAYSDDVARRFEGYGWHVQDLGEAAEDLQALSAALAAARAETRRPSLLIVRSHIGYGAPTRQDTAEAHGAPLGEEEVAAAKRAYGWPEEERFLVPGRARTHMREAGARGADRQAEWEQRLSAYRREHPETAARFDAARRGDPPAGWDVGLPVFPPGTALATRSASGKVLNALAERIPWLIGGSADLAPSTNTLIASSGDFARGAYANRNLRWGVREHAMCAASSGIALHGGLRPYAATFFVFTDYARPAIRLAALMELPVVYVMTHDSIGLGEDGPTHQPIEHLASLRAMPGLRVIRPADANEATWAWREAIRHRGGPTVLVLTRQKLPVFERSGGGLADAEGLTRGGYVLKRESGGAPDLLLLASGSEVAVALDAERALDARGVRARVVSLPCWEIFRDQPQGYRDSVLPPSVRARLAVEAAAPFGWCEWVGETGAVIGIERFGASAPVEDVFRGFGFTPEAVAARALDLVGG